MSTLHWRAQMLIQKHGGVSLRVSAKKSVFVKYPQVCVGTTGIVPFQAGQAGKYKDFEQCRWVPLSDIPTGECLIDCDDQLGMDHREQRSGNREWWPTVSFVFTHPDYTIYNMTVGNYTVIIFVICVYQLLDVPLVAWPIQVSQWAVLPFATSAL